MERILNIPDLETGWMFETVTMRVTESDHYTGHTCHEASITLHPVNMQLKSSACTWRPKESNVMVVLSVFSLTDTSLIFLF